MKEGFRSLRVWRKARELAVFIHEVTRSASFNRDLSLRDQLIRAAVSTPSNIAEGYERDTDPEAVRYFRIAKGSLAELLTQADIAHAVGYIEDAGFAQIETACTELSAMLGKFIVTRLTKEPYSNN